MHLGLHCSRQSFTATITNKETSEILIQRSLHFDEDLTHRDTEGGFIQDSDTHQSYLDPQMLVEAFEMLLDSLYDENPGLIAAVTNISGSSAPTVIFLNQPISEINFNPTIPLIDQLRPHYTSRISPITRDNSATNEAELIKKEFNPDSQIRNITGMPITSNTGTAQIKKLSTEQPEAWEQTSSIHTAGSFLCSLLIGEIGRAHV